MNKYKKLILSLMILSITLPVFAVEKVSQQPITLKAETGGANMDIVVKNNFVKAKYASAINRFLQGNVKASYDDFWDLISRAAHDDYVFLVYSMKMAEFGFFDLSDVLFKRLDNNIYTKNYLNDIRRFYYPSGIVEQKDIIYLADAYASIVYNNLAIETTSELINSKHASETDYKNYLISLGYYKSNNLNQALKYINRAELINNNNVNYKLLKAKILADLNKPKQALKLLKDINKITFTTADFKEKVKATEEYVNYKVAKNETLKDYHLSYYYHLQDKSYLASKVLQASIISAKEHSSKIFALLAKIYYENDEALKAQEFAERAYKEDQNDYLALITLGDLNYESRKYKEALKYYKLACKNSDNIEAIVGQARAYLALEDIKKSKKIYEKMLKKNSHNEDLLIGALKLFPHRSDDYLARIASIDISNNDIWLGLANWAIKDNNYKMAETYLNNSFYIDENNFKYYYYLSLVLRAKGDIEKSNQSMVHCSRLNADYASNIKVGN